MVLIILVEVAAPILAFIYYPEIDMFMQTRVETYDAVFYRTYPLLYHNFGNMVFSQETSIHFVGHEIFSSKSAMKFRQSKIYKLDYIMIH